MKRHFCNFRGGHIRFFSNKCLETLFEKFGFRIIEKKYIWADLANISICLYSWKENKRCLIEYLSR